MTRITCTCTQVHVHVRVCGIMVGCRMRQRVRMEE